MARHSPCIGICKLDDATGFCIGCGRTGSEIGDWMAMSESLRDAIWDKLPDRLAALSVRVRLLPWVRDELVDWVRDSIVARQGTWVVGVPGAVAEFPSTGETLIDVHVDDGIVTARRRDAAFRLEITEKVRAFAFTEGGPIVLGLPRGRAAFPASSTSLRLLGADTGAIDEAQRAHALFDIGIGRRYTRFCVRTGDESLGTALSALDGRHWSDVMPQIQNRLFDAALHRVVESAAARIEVFAKIPRPGEPSPTGAHIQLLPEYLKSGEEIATAIAPPDYAAPVAIFFPSKN